MAIIMRGQCEDTIEAYPVMAGCEQDGCHREDSCGSVRTLGKVSPRTLGCGQYGCPELLLCTTSKKT